MLGSPEFLVRDYVRLEDLKHLILTNNYTSIDTDVPTCRFRGTLIDSCADEGGTFTIIGWQRNTARIRKMDVSLPTIITIQLDREQRITHIELDKSFKGSKGLLCCWRYLNRNLQEALVGRVINRDILKDLKVNKLHCYHLVEVLRGAYSFFRDHFGEEDEIWEVEGRYFEEEVMDVYTEGGDMYFHGKQIVNGSVGIEFVLLFHDLMKKIGFSKNGNLSRIDEILFEFILENRFTFSETISITTDDQRYGDLQKVLIQCMGYIKRDIYSDKRGRFFNTNLYPPAFIGILVQSVGMKLFRNNYHYIMHILTGLQRYEEKPKCIGAVLNNEEARRYFNGFDLKNLL